MAKKHRAKKSAKCPEPINTLLDIAEAATLHAVAKHKIKKDYAKGQGEDSAKAGAIVFGTGAMRRGTPVVVSLGGLTGLASGIRNIEKSEQATAVPIEPPLVDYVSGSQIHEQESAVPQYIWRQYCEDGSAYGLSPYDFKTADEYDDALQAAKQMQSGRATTFDDSVISSKPSNENTKMQPHLWRKFCTDGTLYGLNPEDFETADDYEDAIAAAIRDNNLNPSNE